MNCDNNRYISKALENINRDKKFKTICCVGPAGKDGKDGISETLTIRNTYTGAPGTSAKVIDVTGSPNHVLDFVIPKGADGKCDCKCIQKGELLKNISFETIEDDKPKDWNFTNPLGVESTYANGEVHMGSYAVRVKGNSKISQIVTNISSECYYELSFFLNGKGDGVGIVGTITFITPDGNVVGGTVTIKEGNIVQAASNFGYYKLVSIQAPTNTTSIKVELSAVGKDSQAVIIDDVSLVAL